ncbi:F-box/LRR-repeat protein 7-like [Schistocerca gregaria]|uniref:F-box/LRR-repeat protein 7-like n=1 Tax=Schistocerca gregaria TaxID=7010 RepID=UPI00211DBCBE|nr:F-box/LRR-repeat protein 7-like [Schistocerca gregaria]
MTTTVDDLPDEIMLEIFSYMSLSENVNLLQKVCTRWKSIAQDAKLWYDKQYVIGYTVADEEAIATFRAAPQLRTVIVDREVEPTIFEVLSKSCREVTTLDIDYRQTFHYTKVKNLFDGCKKIRTLKISERGLLADARFVDAVAELAQLRALQLKPYHNVGCRIPLRGLADRCPHLCDLDLGWLHYRLQEAEYFVSTEGRALRRLCVKWTTVERRSIVPLLVKCADTLEYLQLNTYDVVDGEDLETFRALGRLHNLRDLIFDLIHKQIPHVIPVPFIGGGLSNLQLLGLWHIPDLGNDAVLAISKGCPKLRELSLIACGGHTDKAFKLLHQLKQLEILKISSCDCLRGDAVRYISALPALRTLEFRAIKFQKLEPGVECFLDMSGLCRLHLADSVCWSIPFGKFPGRLINLRELYINYCDGDDDELDKIRQLMPECHVEGSLGALITDSE